MALSICCASGNAAPVATTRSQMKNEFELLLICRELPEIEKLFNMLAMSILKAHIYSIIVK